MWNKGDRNFLYRRYCPKYILRRDYKANREKFSKSSDSRESIPTYILKSTECAKRFLKTNFSESPHIQAANQEMHCNSYCRGMRATANWRHKIICPKLYSEALAKQKLLNSSVLCLRVPGLSPLLLSLLKLFRGSYSYSLGEDYC